MTSHTPHEDNEEKKTPDEEPKEEVGEETLDDVTSLSREDLKIRPRDAKPPEKEEEGDADDGD